MPVGPLHAICHRLNRVEFNNKDSRRRKGEFRKRDFGFGIADFGFGEPLWLAGSANPQSENPQSEILNEFHRHTTNTTLDPNVDFGAIILAAVGVGEAVTLEGRRVDVR